MKGGIQLNVAHVPKLAHTPEIDALIAEIRDEYVASMEPIAREAKAIGEPAESFFSSTIQMVVERVASDTRFERAVFVEAAFQASQLLLARVWGIESTLTAVPMPGSQRGL